MMLFHYRYLMGDRWRVNLPLIGFKTDPVIVRSDSQGSDAIQELVQGETFFPGQIFVFAGFVLRANSLGHLEQVDSYAPGHQVRFGSLNIVDDICGDLIFDGFETAAIALLLSDEHD